MKNHTTTTLRFTRIDRILRHITWYPYFWLTLLAAAVAIATLGFWSPGWPADYANWLSRNDLRRLKKFQKEGRMDKLRTE